MSTVCTEKKIRVLLDTNTTIGHHKDNDFVQLLKDRFLYSPQRVRAPDLLPGHTGVCARGIKGFLLDFTRAVWLADTKEVLDSDIDSERDVPVPGVCALIDLVLLLLRGLLALALAPVAV